MTGLTEARAYVLCNTYPAVRQVREFFPSAFINLDGCDWREREDLLSTILPLLLGAKRHVGKVSRAFRRRLATPSIPIK